MLQTHHTGTQSYSVGGQRSPGQFTGKRTGTGPDHRGRWCTIAVLVSVGFIGCWAPYAAVSFWSMFRSSDSIPPLVSLLPCLFAKSATAYNPFIYYIFSKSFRKEIKLLTCFCGKPDDLLNTVNMAENPVNVTCDDKRKQETTLPSQ
ncbi:UNVERIFIED_CONTAM: hypothetical protein FKN15_070750 [Acipenser sinensis]